MSQYLLVLASQSPRRKQLLEQLGRELDFEVKVLGPGPDEDAEGLEAVHVGENPLDYVQRVTHLKAEAGWRRMLKWTDGGFELPVLVSDTTVALGDQVLGKPGSADDARKILRSLSGRVHQVHTAVGLAVPGGSDPGVDSIRGRFGSSFDYVQVVSSSDVKFGDLTNDWIDWVIATGEPMDKAGAYAIQGHAASVIEWVRGSPSGVMGLPLFETRMILEAHGLFTGKSDPKCSHDREPNASEQTFSGLPSNGRQKLSVQQKRDLIIQAGMELIPYVGGSLSSLYFGAKHERRFTRLEEFYRGLSEDFQNFSNVFISTSKNFNELEALIESLHEKVEREPSEEKRRLFRNFFKSVICQDDSGTFDKRRHFLDSLAEMSLFECGLLSKISFSKVPIQVKELNLGVDTYFIVGAIGRLKTRGFVMATQDSFIVGGHTDNSLHELVSVSTFGRAFIDFCLTPEGH